MPFSFRIQFEIKSEKRRGVTGSVAGFAQQPGNRQQSLKKAIGYNTSLNGRSMLKKSKYFICVKSK